MKNLKNVFSLFLLLLAFNVNAQLSGEISLLKDTIWTLSNSSGINLMVKGDKSGRFEIDISKLEKGVYSFGKMGEIFIQPDYKTGISLIKEQYIVTGSGKTENDLLNENRKLLDNFLGNPGYAVKFNYLLTEPSIFIPVLDNYVKIITSKSEQSSNAFFKDFIKQEAELGKRFCLSAYSLFYGLDSSKMGALRKLLSIPVADRKEDYKKELMAAHQAQFSKKLTPEDKELLNKTIYEGWDVNNEILYKNSRYYKTMIGYRIDYLTYLPENQKLRDSLKNDYIIKLNISKNLITNSRIKEDFAYNYTIGTIKRAKDPAEITTIYQSFIDNAKNEKYKLEVKNTFQNLISTLAKAIAPDFNYTNPEGKMVSLKSLRGKYVYIDVWATWCAPCVAEIPSLKKLETYYKDKNIHFVSISVDGKQQKKEWLNFVEKNNLKGIQLMADNDFKSDFIKKFGISSIPRFILIGPDGVIIDNNAKRPSNSELIKQLNTFKL